MIVLDLLCDNQHRFEGWFASSGAFRDQCERSQVQCPVCQTDAIRQLPSAPHVRRSDGVPLGDAPALVATSEAPAKSPEPAKAAVEPEVLAGEIGEKLAVVVRQMHELLGALARHAENVGERFPEEARRIHYDEAPARPIRGVASADETLELLEEGILVLPAPLPPEGELH